MKEKVLVLFFIINIIWQFLKLKHKKIKVVYCLDMIISMSIILILMSLIYIWIIFYDIMSKGADKNDFQILLLFSIIILFYTVKIISYLRKKMFWMQKLTFITSIVIELCANIYFILY